MIEQGADHWRIGVRDIIVSTTDGKDLRDIEFFSQVEKKVSKAIPPKMRLGPIKEDKVVQKGSLDIVKMIAR
jgi:hypothetical protein